MTFGEPFDCLKLKENHPWVTKLFSQFHGATILATCRFFPGFETIMEWILPRSVMDLRWELFRRTQDKITKRLETDTDRLDFIHYVEQYNDEKGMTRDEIDSTFTSLCVAGGETTGTFLSACVYFLIQHPDAMARVTGEIRAAFSRDGDITDSRLEELPYFGAVVKETLRLAPPGAFSHPRQVPAGGRPVAGHFVPEGTVVEVVNWAAMRSAKNFRDPERFRPERWLARSGFDDDDATAFAPFSIGPRGCIGRGLANLEMRLIMARVLWNFDMQIPGGGVSVGWEWSSQNVFMVWDKRPLFVEVKVAER
jgi:cytochrome P450